MMRHINIKPFCMTIVMVILAIYVAGCTDLFSNPGSSSSSSSGSKIGVTISSPVSYDSITYGASEIDYDVTENTGINFIELYVNNKIAQWIPPNTDGTKPAIYLNFDISKIDSLFSYYLIYYDKDGTSVKSTVMDSLIITKHNAPAIEPYDVKLIRLTPTSVNLSWKDSTLDYAPNFEIWRKDGSNGEFVLYLESPQGTFNINDENISPGFYEV